jgi:uncharacterized protein
LLWKAAVAIGVAGVASIAVKSIRGEWPTFRPVRRAPGALPPLPRLRDASFEVDGVTIRGNYADTSNGAVVVLAHGSEGVGAQLGDRAKVLADRGYGVLLFDWPGHGASGGTVTWDRLERNVLARAVDYCLAQPGVDPQRVGAFGFSLGAYILIQVAAADSRISAVAVEGAFGTVWEITKWQYGRFGWLSELPALWADWHFGMDVWSLQPAAVIGRISPRALLVVAGGADGVTPLAMSERLFEAAGEPKEIYVVPDAGHGESFEHVPDEYAARITAFFDRALGVTVRAGG